MKTTIRRGARVAALALAAGVAIGAHATTTVLAMDSLPTAQGWTYDSCWWGCHVPAAEEAWSVDGTSLSLNDYAGAQGASVSGFSLRGVVNSEQPFSIDTRLKIVSGSSPFFYLEASTATQWMGLSFSTGQLQISSVASVNLDTTVFHRYHISAAPGGPVTVVVDGAAVYSGIGAWNTIDPNAIPNTIGFSDGTSGASGTAVISSYSFTQNAAPVPEAGTLSLMVLGLAGGLLWRRRANASR